MHQSCLTFLHWVVTDDYLDYLASDKPGSRLPFLRVYSSSVFDLEKIDERKEAAYGILALAYFLNDEEGDIGTRAL